MPNKTLTIEQVLTLLANTAPKIAALTADLTPAQLRTTPNQDEWSANEVLAHLRSCADMWGSAIVTMIGEERPTLRAVNPLTWLHKTDYLELEFQPSLRDFAKQRASLMKVVEHLPRQAWSRTATVTGAGAVLERNVLFYGRWLAGHERSHIKQIERIVNSMS